MNPGGPDIPIGGAPQLPPLLFGNPYGFSINTSESAKAGCPVPQEGTNYCVGLPLQGHGYFGTNNSLFRIASANGSSISFVTLTLVNGTGYGIAQYIPSGPNAGWATCRISNCGPVANGTWELPLGFVTWDQFVISTGSVDPSGDIFSVNRTTSASWDSGYGSVGEESWEPGQVNISLVGPGVGSPPPPPPIPLDQVLNLTRESEETTSSSGPAVLGCPLPVSGTNYCEVFQVTLASSGINTSDLLPTVQSPSAAIWSFNVTLGASSEKGIARYGNNSPSGGTGWAPCTEARCGANSSSGVPLPANLSQGDWVVICLSGLPPGPNTTLELSGLGRFDGQLTFPLSWGIQQSSEASALDSV